MTGNQQRIHIGTSGWSYDDWRDRFYPEEVKPAGYLPYYARHFQTVEVNNTFYRLPGRDAVRAWRDAVPDSFRFAIKASRYLTHMKKLKDPEEPIARLFDRVEVLGGKLGPVLFQLPPRWRRNPERLSAFLKALPAGHDYAFEFRDHSWFDETIYEILAEHRAALCIYDAEGESSPHEITAEFVYVRMHKPPGHDRWEYGRDDLSQWASAVTSWAEEGHEVYCYFNNDPTSAAIRDAQTMLDLIGAV